MKHFFLIYLCLLTLSIQFSVAQHYYFKQYALEDGLPQSEITAITTDQFGYMWVGTNGGGLCRFNGKTFDIFTKKDGLFNNIILGLHHDHNYDLWIATSKGIQRYDGINYTTIIQSDTTIYSDQVSFCEMPDGEMWALPRLVSGNRQLLRLKDENVENIISKYKNELEDNGPVYRIIPDKKYNALIATRNQLYIYQNEQLSPYPDETLGTGKEVVKLPLLRDRNNRLWLTYFGPNNIKELVIHYDGKGDKVAKLPEGVQDKTIYKGYQDRDGTLWFICQKAGILQYSRKGWRHFNKSNGLPINSFANVLQDEEGNIWLGSLGAGLIRYSGDLFVSLNRSNGLTDDIIRTIFQDSKGKFYFADGEGGFSSMLDNEVIQHNKEQLPDIGSIKDFHELPSGKLLMAATKGLWEYDGKNIKLVNQQYGWKKQLPISDVAVSRDTFLFATYGFGLIKSHNGKATFYNSYNSNMQENTIFHILIDSKNRIWLSTEQGITLYENGKFTPFTEGNEITSSYVLQAAEDKQGNIWFATFTNGLVRYNNKNWTTFNTEQGLSSDNIYSVIADQDGNIFAGTQNGVDKLLIASTGKVVEITSFDRHDGFIGIENNGTANFKDRQGRLWFGTIKGAMCYNPAEKRSNFLAPNVYIRDVELNYKNTDWYSDNYSTLYDSIVPWFNIPDKLDLGSKNNNITFEFDALCFSVPEKVKYHWRLEPLETEWIEGYENKVVYPSLPSGDYTFRVSAANNSGIWNDEGAYFSFSIHPAWYQTTAFRTLIILLIVVLIGTLLVSWQRKNRMVRFEFNTILESKSRELNEQREELQEKTQQLKVQKDKIDTQATAIANSFVDLEKLSDIGQILTANMTNEVIFDKVYQATREVMDSHVFGLGLFNEENKSIDFKNILLNGERMPFITFSLDETSRIAVHCFLNSEEVFINNYREEYSKYVMEMRPVAGDIETQSMIHIPLKTSGKPFGVLTVQSKNKDAYNAYHLSYMRNIGFYAGVTIANVKVFHKLEKQHQSLEAANKSILSQHDELVKQQGKVQQLNNENNHLIDLLTHEMERPITSTVALISSLRTEENIEEEEKDEALQYVFESLWKMKEMVNQVSEIKYLESHNIEVQKNDVNLAGLVKEVAAQYKEQIDEKDIFIEFNLDNIVIHSDYSILEKVIANLLSNAIKFTNIDTQISLRTKTLDNEVLLSITDQGSGIPPEIQEKLFTKFSKPKGSGQNNVPSTGLGLYIVKRYIDLIDGKIECLSQPGKGTTFEVKLPK